MKVIKAFTQYSNWRPFFQHACNLNIRFLFIFSEYLWVDKNLKVIYGKNPHKKRGHFLTLISHRHLVFTFAAAGLPLSRPWYWQGWHQRRALTLGELGLPAVNNQVYFEVRDTWTPRAKAAASPALHTPPTSLQPPSPLVPEIPSTAVLVPDVAKLH